VLLIRQQPLESYSHLEPESPEMKASREHVFLWREKEAAWVYLVLSSICVSTVAYILISVRQPTTPVPSGTLAAIITVSIVLNLLLTQVRDDLVVAAATRFDFVKLWRYRRTITVALRCAGALLLLSVISLEFPSTRSSIVAYVFVGSVVSYLTISPVSFYTDFFSNEGEANLCLKQALTSLDLAEFSRWFRRGVKAMIIRLKEIGVRVAGTDIVFAVNVMMLKGEPVKDTVEEMADGIISLAAPKNESRLQPPSLYDIIETLTRLAQSAREDGLHAVPSYHERISRTWDLLTRSASILGFILLVAIVLYTYFVTGKLPLVFP